MKDYNRVRAEKMTIVGFIVAMLMALVITLNGAWIPTLIFIGGGIGFILGSHILKGIFASLTPRFEYSVILVLQLIAIATVLLLGNLVLTFSFIIGFLIVLFAELAHNHNERKQMLTASTTDEEFVYDHNYSLNDKEIEITEGISTALLDYYAPLSEWKPQYPVFDKDASQTSILRAQKEIDDKNYADRKKFARSYIKEVRQDDDIVYIGLKTYKTDDNTLTKKASYLASELGVYKIDNYDYDSRLGFVGFKLYLAETPSDIDKLITNPVSKTFFVDNPCVDLFDIPLAVDVSGKVFNLPIHHTLIAGVTGSGKGSPIQGIIRQYAPYVKQGLVRLWGIDPKLAELKPYRQSSLFYRLAFDTEDMAALIHEIWTEMKKAQSVSGRSAEVTENTPLNVLFADEFPALVMDKNLMNDKDDNGVPVSKQLYELLSQGRSNNFYVVAATQEVVASVLGQLRTNFSNKIALRLNTSNHVNIVLGEGATDEGAVAHQIPKANKKNNYKSAGIANIMEEDGSISLIRFAYTSDAEVDALVAAFPTPSNQMTNNQGANQPSEEDTETDEWLNDPISPPA